LHQSLVTLYAAAPSHSDATDRATWLLFTTYMSLKRCIFYQCRVSRTRPPVTSVPACLLRMDCRSAPCTRLHIHAACSGAHRQFLMSSVANRRDTPTERPRMGRVPNACLCPRSHDTFAHLHNLNLQLAMPQPVHMMCNARPSPTPADTCTHSGKLMPCLFSQIQHILSDIADH
jgi:hypothetical protein